MVSWCSCGEPGMVVRRREHCTRGRKPRGKEIVAGGAAESRCPAVNSVLSSLEFAPSPVKQGLCRPRAAPSPPTPLPRRERGAREPLSLLGKGVGVRGRTAARWAMQPSAADLANQALVDRLIAEGALWSRPLIAAFRATPRHRFLDRLFQYQRKHDRWREVLTRDPGPEELRLVYSDHALITHVSPAGREGPGLPI